MAQRGSLKMVWFALVMAVAIYIVVAWMIIPEPAGVPVAQAVETQPIPIIYFLALSMLAAAVFVPRFLTDRRQRLITRWALLDAVAILGLAAAFLAREPKLVLPPAVLALAAFLTSFPTDETNAV